MKIKKLVNKIISLSVSACLIISITSVNSFSAVKTESLSQDENNIPLISLDNGKITSINDTGSNLTVVNIQDLHCHKDTQKKIINIIEEINKENKIKQIYVEGGYGKIDVNWLNKITDKKIKEQIIEQLLQDGEITAGEYYASLKNNTVQLKGLDEKTIHQQNVERLSDIMNNQDKYASVIEKVRREIARLNKRYINSENRKFSKQISKYKTEGVDSSKLYIELFKYIDKINNNFDKYNNITKIVKENYPNIATYILLDKESKKIKPEEISNQIKSVLIDLKSVLSYKQYSEMISKTNNLKDISKLTWYINKYATEKNINLNKYSALNKFIEIRKINESLNPVQLLEEERTLIEQIRYAISYDKTEYEIAYISDFEEYFEKYLKYGLTSKDWHWTKKGFNKFRQLYAKYAVVDRIKEVEKDFVELDKYYNINDERNSIFVNNILSNQKIIGNKKPGIRTFKEIIKDSSEVMVVIAGGYHSDELSKMLSEKSVTTVVITPNVTGNIDKANNKYQQIIQEQAVIEAQALAFRLASCSDDITQQKLLLKAGMEALKKGNINEKEIENIIKVIKTDDRNNNIDIQYNNGEFKVNGNSITLDDIEEISDENKYFEIINAVTEFFENAIKVFEPGDFNKAYNAAISRLLFSVAVLISNSNGLPSFEIEKKIKAQDIDRDVVIDGISYSFERFLFLGTDVQDKLFKNKQEFISEVLDGDKRKLTLSGSEYYDTDEREFDSDKFLVNYENFLADTKQTALTEKESKILKKALSKLNKQGLYGVNPSNLEPKDINGNMLSFVSENNIDSIPGYQLIFVKDLKIKNDKQKENLMNIIEQVENKFSRMPNLAIENDGLAIKLLLKNESVEEDNIFQEYVKLTKVSRDVRAIMTKEDFDYMMKLLDSDDKESFNKFNSIFNDYWNKLSEIGKNTIVMDKDTIVFSYSGFDDVGEVSTKNLFDSKYFKKFIDLVGYAKYFVYGQYGRKTNSSATQQEWDNFVKELNTFIEQNKDEIKNKKIVVYVNTHGNRNVVSLYGQFSAFKNLDDIGEIVDVLPEGSTLILDSCHSSELALNILREFSESKANIITATSPQHNIGYFLTEGGNVVYQISYEYEYTDLFSNLIYSIINRFKNNKKDDFTLLDNSLAEPKGSLQTSFINGTEVERINKEIAVKLHNLINSYKEETDIDEDSLFAKIEKEQEELPDYERHGFNVAELSISGDDKYAPVWEELVFGTAVTALLAVFMISNPLGWFTGIATGILFVASRLGFTGIHSVVEYLKYGKDKSEIRKNFMARLSPTTILSIPYAIVLFSGFGTFLPALSIATIISMAFHYYWNSNEAKIERYLNKVPYVKNLPYIKMLIGDQSKYQAVENGTFPFRIVGIKSDNKMNNNYILFLIMTYLSGLSRYTRADMTAYLSREDIASVSGNFIENIINNKDIKKLNDYDLKSIIMGIILTLYPGEIENIFNGNSDDVLQYKLTKIKDAKFNDSVADDFPKNALANSELEFRTFDYKEKNIEQNELSLPYRNTLIGLITDALHELRHIELDRKNKNYPGFLPEFYAETGSCLDVLKLAQKCKTKQEKEEFYKTLPIHYNFQLLSSEHRTARAFNQIFFDVFETDISKWEALENIIFDVNTGNTVKEDKTPIEYIEIIIDKMKGYTDEKGNSVFDIADIEQIENKMEQSWQYFIYKTVKADPELKKEIDKKVKSGEITMNIDEKNKSAYTKKWMYPGYEYLASDLLPSELIKTILNYYDNNSDKKIKNYYKMKTLKVYEFFKDGFEFCFNTENKPSISEREKLYSYRNRMEYYEKEFLSKDIYPVYKDLKNELGVSEKNLREINYGRVIYRKRKINELKDIINDTNMEPEVRLLAYGYLMANSGNEQGLSELQDLKKQTKILLGEYVDGKKKIENDVDLRAIGVGVALTLLNETYKKEYATIGYEIKFDYEKFINLEPQNISELYKIILQSNIVKEAKGKDMVGAYSNMFFASLSIVSIAHEIGHNIFNFKQSNAKNSTLRELAADTCAAMLMQILGKDITNIEVRDYLYKLFHENNVVCEYLALNEYAAERGLIWLLYIASKEINKEMSFSEFFKFLLEDTEKTGNIKEHKNQHYLLREIIINFMEWLKKNSLSYDEDEIKHLEDIIMFTDSWKVFITELTDYLRINNKDMYAFLMGPNGEIKKRIKLPEAVYDKNYTKYIEDLLNKKHEEYMAILKKETSNIYLPEQKKRELEAKYEEYNDILLNSYVLSQPNSFGTILNLVEINLNNLSDTDTDIVISEFLKQKNIDTDNLDKLSELLPEDKNILVKLIIVKDELSKDDDDRDRAILRVLFNDKGVDELSIKNWLDNNNISGKHQYEICNFFKTQRGNLSCKERNGIINIINGSSVERKDEITAKLKEEQEIIIKVKIVEYILKEYVNNKKEKFIRMEDINDVTKSVLSKISQQDLLSETDLENIIKNTLEEVMNEKYEKNKLTSVAMLPENKSNLINWLESNIEKLDRNLKLKQAFNLAIKELLPSLTLGFVESHADVDKKTAGNLQKVTVVAAVIFTSLGIAVSLINPLAPIFVHVALLIVPGFVGTLGVNIVYHISIIYKFINKYLYSRGNNKKREQLAIFDLSEMAFNEGNKNNGFVNGIYSETNRAEFKESFEKSIGKIIISKAQDEQLATVGLNYKDDKYIKEQKYMGNKYIYVDFGNMEPTEQQIEHLKKANRAGYRYNGILFEFEDESETQGVAMVVENKNKLLSWTINNFEKLNGIAKLKTSLKFAIDEFSPSLYSSFKEKHYAIDKQAADNLQKVTLASSVFFVICGFVSVALNPVVYVALPVIVTVIALISGTNVAYHTIIIYKYINSIEELKKEYGNLINIEADGEILVPVYVTNNIEKFIQEKETPIPVGINTKNGNQIYKLNRGGLIIFGTASPYENLKDIADSIDGSAVDERIKSMNVDKVIIDNELKENNVEFTDDGIIKISEISFNKFSFTQQRQYIKEISKAKQTEAITLADNRIFSLTNMDYSGSGINESSNDVNDFKIKLENGQGIKIISSSQVKGGLITKEYISNLKAKEIYVYIEFDKWNNEFPTDKELENLNKKGIEGYVIKDKEKTEINGVEGWKDTKTMVTFNSSDEKGIELTIPQLTTITIEKLRELIRISETPVVIDVVELEKLFESNGDKLDSYNDFYKLFTGMFISFKKLSRKNVVETAYNISFADIPIMNINEINEINWNEIIDSNNQISILYNSIEDDKKTDFEEIIKYRILAKNIITELNCNYTEQNREVKKLEKLLIKNIKKQEKIDFEKIKSETNNIKEIVENTEKTLEQNKMDLWNSLTERETVEDAISVIATIIDIIADENKLTGNIDKDVNNMAQDYRAMLAAA